MSIPTTDQRARGWNIKFFIDTSPIAGIYQHADFLSIGDVARDLDLCLVFELPSLRDGWRPVLLPRGQGTVRGAILLDHTNTQSFPGPEGVSQYTYLFHSESLCPGAALHTNTSLYPS